MMSTLGPEGELAWLRLSAAYQLESRRGVALVLWEHPEALEEVRRRLTELAPLLESMEPNKGVVVQIYRVVGAAASTLALPVIWVQAAGGAELDFAWRHALAALNRAREELSRAGYVFLILAGPPKFGRIVGARAPDLWSVATPIIRLDALPVAV